jgi:hypothetical protein
MVNTVVMRKDTGHGCIRYEITSNKSNTFGGNKNGKANWVVYPHLAKSYKTDKLIPIYKELKDRGFTLECLY